MRRPRTAVRINYPPGAPVVRQSCTRRNVHNHQQRLNAPSLPACEWCTVTGVPHHYHLGINGYVVSVHYVAAEDCQWPETIKS